MPPSPDTHSFFINTILLGGTTTEKVEAAADAGFSGVELWTHDVDQFGDPDALRSVLRDRRIDLIDFQVLRDFDGAPDDVREAKRAEAERYLDRASALGAPMILVAASTDPRSIADRIVDDLRWLAARAEERGIRVAYESLSWSTRNATLPDAWASVRDADRENLGIVIDPFHVFVHGRTAADLDGIPPHKVFLVQLSDLFGTVAPEHVIEIARHHRLLPGDGVFDLHGVLTRLVRAGYEGPIGLEVFSDDLRAADPHETARRAMAALRACVTRAYDAVAAEGGYPRNAPDAPR